MAKTTIKVEIVNGGYCECGCKGNCDTREIVITKNKRKKSFGICSDIEDLLKEISKKKYFKFEIVKLNKD